MSVDPLAWCPYGCGHFLIHHEIYEPGDPYPICICSDCRCGQPGDAICVRQADGTVTVSRADLVIRVSRELLDNAEPWVWDDETLTLDTAGTYRYRYLRPDPADERRVLLFGRVLDGS